MPNETDRLWTLACVAYCVFVTIAFFAGWFEATRLTAGLASFMGVLGWSLVYVYERKYGV